MNKEEYKKFTLQAKTCIKGEAFFESLVAEYSIPHHIVGPKDIGVDYICEWVHGDKPTGVLYAVQIKTFSERSVKPELAGGVCNLNGLETYEIKDSNFEVDLRTLHYWKGLGMPFYLFAICVSDVQERMDCFYKRFTSELTKEELDRSKINFFSDFYKVNKGDRFVAFADEDKKENGFARDLFIDYMRWVYYKGSIAYFDPNTIGLGQFAEDEKYKIYKDLFEEYEVEIIKVYAVLTKYLGETGKMPSPEELADIQYATEATPSIQVTEEPNQN
jgi:hypothetical protein